jgi:hypothetical protein
MCGIEKHVDTSIQVGGSRELSRASSTLCAGTWAHQNMMFYIQTCCHGLDKLCNLLGLVCLQTLHVWASLLCMLRE